MNEIRQLHKPVKTISKKLETEEKTTFNDLNFFIIKNTDIEDPEKVKETREFLEDHDVIETKENNVTEIDVNKFEDLAGLNKKQKPLMEENFPLDGYLGLNKSDIAQEYANWLVNECNIRPVWIDGRTLFYRYDKSTNTWKHVKEKLIFKKARKDIQHEFTKHFHNEFKAQLRHHHEFLEFEEMGLPENEVLLKDGKIIDLENYETRQVSPEDYALNSLNTTYNPESEGEELKNFIEKTIDKPEMVKTLQEYLGYTLTFPSNDYEKMLLILGQTDTGKSTLIEVIQEMFGDSNISEISFPQLGMERAFHVGKLKDSILNIDRDMDDSDISRKSRIKKIISKESIFAEDKGQDGYNFKPKANHIVASNNAPDDAGATDAYYNRFLTITATSRIPEEEKDRELSTKLKKEENLEWLFNWALEGLERLNEQNNFTFNPTEYETKKIWDTFGNSVQKFIANQITVDSEEGENYRTQDVYEVYKKWMEEELEQPLSRQKFIALASNHPDMTKRKTEDKYNDRAMCFIDLKIKDYVI